MQISPADLKEMLSGEHGVMALAAARALKSACQQLEEIRAEIQRVYDERSKQMDELRKTNTQLAQENMDLQDKLRAAEEKYAVLVDIRKDMGLDDKGDKPKDDDKKE